MFNCFSSEYQFTDSSKVKFLFPYLVGEVLISIFDLMRNLIIIKCNCLLHFSNSDIRFHKLTCIFHKRLFMPYLPQVGGDHHRKGIWFRWMGVFHCPVKPSSFPHLLPSLHILPCSPPPPPSPPSPSWGLPTVPKPWGCLFMPGWHYLSESSTHVYIPAYPSIPG